MAVAGLLSREAGSEGKAGSEAASLQPSPREREAQQASEASTSAPLLLTAQAHDAEAPPSHKKRYAQRFTTLPAALDSASSGAAGMTQQHPDPGWWFEEGLSLLPSDDLITLEWTPQATHLFLPSSSEVETWIHTDESCLLTSRGGRFVCHLKDANSPEQLFAASCVPEYVWSADQSGRYALGNIASHALKLR
jgi:hypothetical protein